MVGLILSAFLLVHPMAQTGLETMSKRASGYLPLIFCSVQWLFQILVIIDDIAEAMKDILWEATWMDVNTTKVALAKSSSMLTVAAYPEDYVTNKSAIDEYYEEVRVLLFCSFKRKFLLPCRVLGQRHEKWKFEANLISPLLRVCKPALVCAIAL